MTRRYRQDLESAAIAHLENVVRDERYLMSRHFFIFYVFWNAGVFESRCFVISPQKVRHVMDITPMSNGDSMDLARKEEWSRVVVGLVQQV